MTERGWPSLATQAERTGSSFILHLPLTTDALSESVRFDLDFGRPLTMTASPKRDLLALTNHRHELVLVDIQAGTSAVLDESLHAPIQGTAWSPDGRWLAYGFHDTSPNVYHQTLLCGNGGDDRRHPARAVGRAARVRPGGQVPLLSFLPDL